MGAENWLAEWDMVVAQGESSAIEEFWLARLDEGTESGDVYAEALRRLRAASKKTLAATLLELAADQAGSDGSWPTHKMLLGELIRLGIGDEQRWRAGLVECVRHIWEGRPSLEKLLNHFPLTTARRPLEVLEQLENWLSFDVGGVFMMAGRGPGQVVEANPQLGMLRLDLEREKRVPMPIDAARKYLLPLPVGHFLRRRFEEPEALLAEVISDPQGGLLALLQSFDVPMTVTEIRAALGTLVRDDQWSAWWNRAKKHPRLLAEGSGTKVQYRLSRAEEAGEEVREAFAQASLTSRIELARRHGQRDREIGLWMAKELLAAAQGGEGESRTLWEALALAARLGADAAEVSAAQRALLARLGPIEMLSAAGDVSQREAVLALIAETSPDTWPEVFVVWLGKETSARLLSVMASGLVAAGETARVRGFLDAVFLHPLRYPAALVWACEAEDQPLLPLLEERRSGALLVRLVELAERRELGTLRARLKEVLSPRGMAGRILQDRLSVEQGRRLLQILERPGELADERSWLRRAITMRFPELRRVEVSDVMPALASTVERLRDDLRDLLERQIPETLKAIQVAKEHGDLSENFEYHAARARQEFLSARAAQFQTDIARVQVIDPAGVDCSQVRVGTRVTLIGGDGGSRGVTILGTYEADAAKGIVSNESEAAVGLLGRHPGDAVSFDGDAWTIGAIEPVAG